MDAKQLQKLILDELDEIQAKDLITLDVRGLTDVTDTMIICTGTSKRHVKSIADNLVTKVKQEQLQPLGIEGFEYGEWILVDLGDIVVHIMLPQIREFYSLEKLWATTEESRQANAD